MKITHYNIDNYTSDSLSGHWIFILLSQFFILHIASKIVEWSVVFDFRQTNKRYEQTVCAVTSFQIFLHSKTVGDHCTYAGWKKDFLEFRLVWLCVIVILPKLESLQAIIYQSNIKLCTYAPRLNRARWICLRMNEAIYFFYTFFILFSYIFHCLLMYVTKKSIKKV